jgi:hypothetical protein
MEDLCSVDDTPEDKVSKQEVVSDFEYSSDPFVEFKLFYKDGRKSA